MTTYDVQIMTVEPKAMSAIRAQVNFERLSVELPGLFDEVYEFLKSNIVTSTGRNIVLFLDDVPNIKVAVEIAEPFTGNDRVVTSSTPGGSVATTKHWGEYADLRKAHVAIRGWCEERGHHCLGTNWEYYGHWSDDPTQRLTEVFYLLGSKKEPSEQR